MEIGEIGVINLGKTMEDDGDYATMNATDYVVTGELTIPK